MARRLTKNNAILTLSATDLSIETYSPLFKETVQTTFQLSNIRGFEIAFLKNTTKLILYLQGGGMHAYRLYRDSERKKIAPLLTAHISTIKASDNPYFPVYKLAFKYCAKHSLITFLSSALVIMPCVYFNSWTNIPKYWLWLTILIFLPALLTWAYILPKLRKKYFRYEALSPLPFLIAVCSNIFLIWGVYQINSYLEQPLKLESLTELNNYDHSRTLMIKNEKIAIPNFFLHTYKSTRSKRSMYNNYTHYFFTPLTDIKDYGVRKHFNVWIIKLYNQKIRKSTDLGTRLMLLSEFKSSTIRIFFKEIEKDPMFYTVLYSDLITAKEFKYGANFIKSNPICEGPLIILKPHYESMDHFKTRVLYSVMAIFAGAIAVNIGMAALLALQR
ncbi:MAG: hypothetical protein EOO89_06645 [Pedobacter sp.]|nr:MAG: hypothetical protein EOO89_06645 [Pedobacter sp.]